MDIQQLGFARERPAPLRPCRAVVQALPCKLSFLAGYASNRLDHGIQVLSKTQKKHCLDEYAFRCRIWGGKLNCKVRRTLWDRSWDPKAAKDPKSQMWVLALTEAIEYICLTAKAWCNNRFLVHDTQNVGERPAARRPN